LSDSIRFALYTGLRLDEQSRFEVAEFGGIRCIVVETGKSKHAQRVVPLHRALDGMDFDAIRRRNPSTNSRMFTRLLGRLGIRRPEVSWHSLRHSFATALDRAPVAVDADTAAALLGHARAFTWRHYSSGAGIRKLKDAVDQLSFGDDQQPAPSPAA